MEITQFRLVGTMTNMPSFDYRLRANRGQLTEVFLKGFRMSKFFVLFL